MKKWLSENAAILAVIGIFVVAKVPSLTMPFFWDEAGAYIPPSIEVAQRGLLTALPGFHGKGFLAGHPPVLYLLHGILYRIFGTSIAPHRIAQLAFAIVGLWFTYRLGCFLCGRPTGICAAILLACTPMFFAQSTMVLGDLPITSLGVMSAYYLLANQRLAYVLVATLLLQTKETALAIAVAAAVYEFSLGRKEKEGWRRVLMHAVPIGSMALFFAIEYLGTRSFVQATYFDRNPILIFNPADPARALVEVLHNAGSLAEILFYQGGHVILTALLLPGLVLGRKFWKPEFKVFGLVLVFFWGAFSFIAYLIRYVMPILPFICIAAAWSVYILFKHRSAVQYAVVGVAGVMLLPFFYTHSASGNFETNMSHQKAVKVSRRLIEHLDTNFPGALVAADFPISAYLRIPELGYVKKRRPIFPLDEIKFDERAAADLFVYFSLSPSAQNTGFREQVTGQTLRRFEEDGIYAEIYDWRSRRGR